MKDQYFGDINDFRKYSLIRHLGGDGKLSVTVCWMLTPDDSETDGRRTSYLEQPEVWRRDDPVVFEHLRNLVMEQGVRSVKAIENAGVLRNCQFFGDGVEDNAAQRGAYFERFLEFAAGTDLVFFDPDNGLGVKSIPVGARNSSKYVYLDEIAETYSAGHSILVYQHFPRKQRGPFLAGLAQRLGEISGSPHILSFATAHVAFLLIPLRDHQEVLFDRAISIGARYPGRINVRDFCLHDVAGQKRHFVDN